MQRLLGVPCACVFTDTSAALSAYCAAAGALVNVSVSLFLLASFLALMSSSAWPVGLAECCYGSQQLSGVLAVRVGLTSSAALSAVCAAAGAGGNAAICISCMLCCHLVVPVSSAALSAYCAAAGVSYDCVICMACLLCACVT
jgi:hypothetical protein